MKIVALSVLAFIILGYVTQTCAKGREIVIIAPKYNHGFPYQRVIHDLTDFSYISYIVYFIVSMTFVSNIRRYYMSKSIIPQDIQLQAFSRYGATDHHPDDFRTTVVPFHKLFMDKFIFHPRHKLLCTMRSCFLYLSQTRICIYVRKGITLSTNDFVNHVGEKVCTTICSRNPSSHNNSVSMTSLLFGTGLQTTQVSVVEDFMFFVASISTATHNFQYVCAVRNYVICTFRLDNKHALFKLASDAFSELRAMDVWAEIVKIVPILGTITKLVNSVFSGNEESSTELLPSEMGLDLQSGNDSDAASVDWTTRLTTLASSKGVKSLALVTTLIIGLVTSITDGNVSRPDLLSHALKQVVTCISKIDTGATLLEALCTSFKVLHACMSEGSLTPLFSNGDEAINDFTNRVWKFIHRAEAAPSSQEVISSTDISTEFERLIRESDTLSFAISKCPVSIRSSHTNLIAKLKNTFQRFIVMSKSQGLRICPMGVLIAGVPGIGKSSIDAMLTDVVTKIHKRRPDDVMSFSIPCGESKFWDNASASALIAKTDDIGSQVLNQSSHDAGLESIIVLCNNAPYVAPSAIAEQKGTIMVAPNLVVATANSLAYGAHLKFATPFAVWRRLWYILDVSVKKEFAHTDGRLDSSKSHLFTMFGDVDGKGGIPNAWVFILKEVTVTEAKPMVPEHRTIKTFHDIRELLRHFSDTYVSYIVKQKQIVLDNRNTGNCFCDVCGTSLTLSNLNCSRVHAESHHLYDCDPHGFEGGESLSSTQSLNESVRVAFSTESAMDSVPVYSPENFAPQSLSFALPNAQPIVTSLKWYTAQAFTYVFEMLLICFGTLVGYVALCTTTTIFFSLWRLSMTITSTYFVYVTLDGLGIASRLFDWLRGRRDAFIEYSVRQVWRIFSDRIWFRTFSCARVQEVRVHAIKGLPLLPLLTVSLATMYTLSKVFKNISPMMSTQSGDEDAEEHVVKQPVHKGSSIFAKVFPGFISTPDSDQVMVEAMLQKEISERAVARLVMEKDIKNIYQTRDGWSLAKVTDHALSATGKNDALQHRKRISSSIVYYELRTLDDIVVSSSTAINTHDNVFLSTAHILRDWYKKIKSPIGASCDMLLSVYRANGTHMVISYNLMNFEVAEDRDFMMFYISGPCGPDLRQLYNTAGYRSKSQASIETLRLEDGLKIADEGEKLAMVRPKSVSGVIIAYSSSNLVPTDPHYYVQDYAVIGVHGNSAPMRGDSGAPVLVYVHGENLGLRIHGIHLGVDSSNNTYCLPITLADITMLSAKVNASKFHPRATCALHSGRPVFQQVGPFLGDGHKLGDRVISDPINWLPTLTRTADLGRIVTDAGYDTYTGGNRRSDVKDPRTRIPAILRGYHSLNVPPPTEGNRVKQNHLKKHTGNTVPSTLIQSAIKGLGEHYINKMRSEGIHPNTAKISLQQALGGIPDCSHIGGVNLQTGCGYPIGGKKSSILKRHEDTKEFIIPPELERDMAYMKKAYKNYQSAGAINMAATKDQAIAPEKALAGKTRYIFGATLASIVINRELFSGLISMVQRNYKIFHNCPGVNPESEQWSGLVKNLQRLGPETRYSDGDFAAHDVSCMSSDMVEGLMAMLIKINLEFGGGSFDDDDILIMQGLANDLAHPLVYLGGNLYRFRDCNLSGHSLTTHIAGQATMVLLMSNWAMHVNGAGFDWHDVKWDDYFKQNTAMVYGDDHCVGTVTPDYHFEAMQKIFTDWRIGYTPAHKGDATYQSKPVSELGFLKRSFVYCDRIGMHKAPLDKSVIDSLLCHVIRSKSITETEQTVLAIETAHRIASQHTMEFFDKVTEDLLHIAAECNLGPYFAEYPFPTYVDYEESAYRGIELRIISRTQGVFEMVELKD